MKRGGILNFILNLLIFGTLWFGAFSLSGDLSENATGWEGLGNAFLGAAIGILVLLTIPFGVFLVVKILHLITGWKLFSVLCILLNIVLIIFIGYLLIGNLSEPGNAILLFLGVAAEAIGLVTEIKGLSAA